ncbi:hypothetical protein D9M68_674230 [compost metagenome]
MAGGADQAGADLDDLHFFQWPSAFFGGGFQIDYQPMSHMPSCVLQGRRLESSCVKLFCFAGSLLG